MVVRKSLADINAATTVLRNAASKEDFRNTLARYVTAYSISHKSVTSKEFRSLILIVNPEATYVLLRSSSSLGSRITRNFRA
jgi:hypothetical protein